MAFLNAKNPTVIKILRAGVVTAGFKAQTIGYDLGQQFHIGANKQKRAPKTAPTKTAPH